VIEYLKNKFVMDIIWSGGGTAVMGVCGISINMIIAVKYGAENLGIFNQVLSIYVITSIISVWGMQDSVVIFSAEKSNRHELKGSLLLSPLVSVFTISLLITISLTYFSPLLSGIFDSPNIEYALRNILLGLPFFSINKIYMAFLNGTRRMKLYSICYHRNPVNPFLLCLYQTQDFFGYFCLDKNPFHFWYKSVFFFCFGTG
jgi:O-antigen/teichoic acid export membrane protein